MTVIYFLSQVFEPSLAAYAIDLLHRFPVSVNNALDLNNIRITDDPVQIGSRNNLF